MDRSKIKKEENSDSEGDNTYNQDNLMKIIKQQQIIEEEEKFSNSNEGKKNHKKKETNNKKPLSEANEEEEDGSYNEDESEPNEEEDEEESSIKEKKKSKIPQLKKKRHRETSKKKKKNKRNLNELFEIEAEDDDDEEESFEAEGEISVQEQNKILKQLNNNKLRGQQAKEQMKKFYDRPAEEIAESYENMEKDEEESQHGSKNDVSQHLKQPSIKDSKLWLVKCKINKEKESVQSLYHKYFSKIDSDNPLK